MKVVESKSRMENVISSQGYQMVTETNPHQRSSLSLTHTVNETITGI